jgi:tetratricopeptide (TPR) repeat protein
MFSKKSLELVPCNLSLLVAHLAYLQNRFGEAVAGLESIRIHYQEQGSKGCLVAISACVQSSYYYVQKKLPAAAALCLKRALLLALSLPEVDDLPIEQPMAQATKQPEKSKEEEEGAAVDALAPMREMMDNSISQPEEKEGQAAPESRRNLLQTALWSLLGRVYLQASDLVSAESCFRQSAESGANPAQVSANSALLNLAKEQYGIALELFSAVMASGGDDENGAHADSINNYAACALHKSQGDEAIDTLENLLATNPIHTLSPTVVSNLWCLYKLKSDDRSSSLAVKKYAY